MKPGDLTVLHTPLYEPCSYFDSSFLQPLRRVGWRIRTGEVCLVFSLETDWAGILWAGVICSQGIGWIDTSNLRVISTAAGV